MHSDGSLLMENAENKDKTFPYIGKIENRFDFLSPNDGTVIQVAFYFFCVILSVLSSFLKSQLCNLGHVFLFSC